MPVSKVNEKPEKQPPNCHSRYAPGAEALRHLNSSLAGREPALVFILGAGRNFLGMAVRQILPKAMTVVLQACEDFDATLVDPGDLYWSPASPYPLAKILSLALSSGKAAGGIAVVEWPPATRNCSAVRENIHTALQQALELYAAGSATSAYWGQRWIKNSIDFVCGEGPLALPGMDSIPVVIACAGPGLDNALPAIKAAGNKIRLWALASAHQALAKGGLEPELVLATDPGFWNGAHLAFAARNGTMIAATPSTRLGAAILDGPCAIVPVCTGLGFELDALAAAGGISGIKALASGTATGSALSLACNLNSGPLYLCGLDLAAEGLSEHASPYAFDILDEMAASRLTPGLALRFDRIMDGYPESKGGWRLSRAFSTYATDTTLGISRNDIFRISNSPVDTPIRRIHLDQLLSSKDAGQAGSSSKKAQVVLFHRQLMRKTRFEAMTERLVERSEQALAILKECASTGLPVPSESVLELFAFGGRGCASAVASTARGEVCKQEILEAEKAVRTGVRDVTRGFL
jgi:hypothetical protein